MAKITRAKHKIFGGSGSSDNFAKFGSLVAAAPVKTKDIATIQSLPAWDDGFQDAIYGANKDLLLEDLNACLLEHSTQVAYILQAGVPEWESTTEYSKGSLVQRTSGSDATGQVYQSLIDANTGNAPPASASNASWLWVNPPAAILPAAPTINVIPKVSLVASTIGVAGSASLADSHITDDGATVGISLPLKFPDNTTQATTAAPVSSQNDLGPAGAGTRTSDVVYHNTSGKPIFVSIIGAGPTNHYWSIFSDAGAAPTLLVSYSYFATTSAMPTFFIVLPGNYYKMAQSGGAGSGITVTSWIEWS